jgi:NTE family protein
MVLPDVLVLAAGGILGEAWMSGFLAGVEDAQGLDFRETESFVGTSAGSIVAARLAAGERPRRPRGGE